ncbi:hypothetical protein [Micromonospora sp. NPDC023633]|uniref:hypothetical protein n=1 Tax=Micromonospora sp. NPDC023633 TaxID=3154320 RepID=UPI0033EC7C9D
MTAALRDVQPLDLVQALRDYAAHLAVMTDDELAVERARIEALPRGMAHRLVDREVEARQALQHEREIAAWEALVAAMAPPCCWGWTA